MNKTFGIFIFYLLLMLGGSILITGLVELKISVLMLGTFIAGSAFVIKTKLNLEVQFWKDE